MKLHLTAIEVLALRDLLKSTQNTPELLDVYNRLSSNIMLALGGQDKIKISPQKNQALASAYFDSEDSSTVKNKVPEENLGDFLWRISQQRINGFKKEEQTVTVEAPPEVQNANNALWNKFQQQELAKMLELQKQLDAMKKDRGFMVPSEDDKFDDFGYPRKGFKRPPAPNTGFRGKRRATWKK